MRTVVTGLLLATFLAGCGEPDECPPGFAPGEGDLCLQTGDEDTDDAPDTDTVPGADTDTDAPVDSDTDVPEPPADADNDGYDAAADCDDADAAVHPGAPEICDNGVDDDCDVATGCRWDAVMGPADSQLDGSKILGLQVGDVTEDGVDDLVVGSYEGADGVLVIFAAGALAGDATATATHTLSEPDEFAFEEIAVGELDGDGHVDIVVSRGAGAYLYPGPVVASGGIGATAIRIGGGALSSPADPPSLALGDHDGDGAADLAVGDYGYGTTGRVSVLAGPVDSDRTTDNAVVTITGFGSRVGGDVSLAGDLDGDGLADLVLTEESARPIKVFLGDGLPGVYAPADADISVEGVGVPAFDRSGPLSPADVDGDGYDDLAAGMPLAGVGNEAFAFVFYGPLGAGTRLATDAETQIWDGDATDFGAIVEMTRDVDGDGFLDAVVAESTENNRLHVYYGPLGYGTLDAEAPGSYATLRENNDRWDVAVGDFDADGASEAAVSYFYEAALGSGVVDVWAGAGI